MTLPAWRPEPGGTLGFPKRPGRQRTSDTGHAGAAREKAGPS